MVDALSRLHVIEGMRGVFVSFGVVVLIVWDKGAVVVDFVEDWV